MQAEAQSWLNAIRDGAAPSWLVLEGADARPLAARVFAAARNLISEKAEDKLSFIPHPLHWPLFMAHRRQGVGAAKLTDLKQWPVCWLEEIGTENDPIANDELIRVLAAREGKWTLITMGLPVKDLEQRLATRLERNSSGI